MHRSVEEAGQRLSIPEKCAYAAGDAASSLYWKTFEYFLLFYYTDVFGISAGNVATMLLITRIGDAIVDPLMGVIADRTRTRWGRFRPYLLWFSLPLPAVAVITFTTPHVSAGAKLVYAYITYTLLMLTYTAINIPYNALMGVLSSNSQQRTSASSWRFAFAFIATMFVQKYTASFVKYFGSGNDAIGWQRTMLVFGALAVVMFLICFSCTRERVRPSEEHAMNIIESLTVAFSSRSWRLLFTSVTMILAAYGIRGAASAYYFKYFLHREDLLGSFLVANGISAFVGIIVTSALARTMGKKNAMILCCLLGGALFGFLWVAHPQDIRLVFAVQITSSLAIGPIAPLFFAMFADVADESEWVTRKRLTGLFFASALFAVKVGAAVGGSALGLVLSICGYVSNTEQTLHSLQAITASMSWIPATLLVLAGALLIRYNLTESELRKIEDDLLARQGETTGKAELNTVSVIAIKAGGSNDL
jgi:glycoside/pentoside/hexuronide:cation symporter, GPH family